MILTENNRWIPVAEKLPKPFQTVWLTNAKKWVGLGCLVEGEDGWHWAQSNGVIYVENGEIVSECESEDLDVEFWHELPKLNEYIRKDDVIGRHSWLNKDDLEFAIALQEENKLEAVKWLCEKAKGHSMTPLKDAKDILDAFR